MLEHSLSNGSVTGKFCNHFATICNRSVETGMAYFSLRWGVHVGLVFRKEFQAMQTAVGLDT